MANNNNQQAANTPTIEELQKQLAEANEKAAAAEKRADDAEKEVAQAKEQLAAMANKPDEAPVEEVPEKRVKVFIERGSAHDEPNLLVSVNGVNYLLPRGEESEVPESVAYEINRSRKALNRYDKTRESLLGK